MSIDNSALLYLSSEHSVLTHPEQGRWEFNIGNTVYMDKVVRIVPTTILVPNIFPNVNIYNNKFSITDDLDVTTNYEMEVGQYTLDELVVALNAAVNDINITWETIDSKVNLLLDGSGTIHTDGPYTDFFDLIGWTSIANAVDGGHAVSTAGQVLGPDVVNIGGEKLVFLTCDKIAPSNAIHGLDGTAWDIFGVVSFHDAEYGQTAEHRAADVRVDDVEFKGQTNLDTLVIEIKDSKMRALPFPSNYHIRVVFKVYHRDGCMGKSASTMMG